MSRSSTNEQLESALRLASLGWNVFPVFELEPSKNGAAPACACRKADCEHIGKHPRTTHGFHDATTDEERIREWWRQWPHANLAVRTGATSGVVALDIDPRNGGDITLAELESEHGPLPPTVEAITGGGGRHLLFAHPGGHVRSRENARGIDVKGDGGYIVVEPSLHASGKRYAWELSSMPGAVPLAPLPAWLSGHVSAPPNDGPTPTGASSDGGPIPEGQRDNTLTSLAGAMRRRGMGEASIRAALLVENRERCTPPLPEEQVEKIARSIARYDPAQGTDSFPAPLERKGARMHFAPIPITEIGPSEPPGWIWPGFVARGHVTLFTSLWKSGKTTLAAHLVRDLGVGGSLAEGVEHANVLILSEESPSLWARRRDDLSIGAHVHLVCRPFKGRPTLADWLELVELVAAYAKGHSIGLVIFDTLAGLWPVIEENDAGAVLTALAPLHLIAETGAGVILFHHPRKGDAADGQASRGSGALPGFVDVIVEMRRYVRDDSTDRRRVLSAHSRFDDTPRESILELTDAGYVFLGDGTRVRRGDHLQQISRLLPEASPGLTVDEIRRAWPAEPKPGVSSLREDLAAGVPSRWHRSGSGHRGDPHRFHRVGRFDSRTTRPLGGGNESTEGPDGEITP